MILAQNLNGFFGVKPKDLLIKFRIPPHLKNFFSMQ